MGTPEPIRPTLDGALADAIRADTRARGMKFEVEVVRLVLTDYYREKGWLVDGDDGDLAYRKPPPSDPT